MTSTQRRTVFGLAKGLNINTEELHVLVNGLTGCTSLTELTDEQADAVIRDMRKRMRYGNRTAPLKKKAVPAAEAGMITAEQQKKAWALMYELKSLDVTPKVDENGKEFSVGRRMAGAIEKLTGNNMAALEVGDHKKNIFKHVTFDEGEKLIEGLKRYVRTAKRKKKKAGENSESKQQAVG